MSCRLVMVCEGQADRNTACELADRVLCERIDWLEPELLEYQRAWQGLTEADAFLSWKNAAHQARAHGIRVQGDFEGEPRYADAQAALRALRLIKLICPEAHGVLLIRDSDLDPERKEGLNLARDKVPLKNHIVIGVAHPQREAWVLAGFEPSDDVEAEALRQLRQDLGFHPCEQAHELTAKHDHDKRSAKRVLARLTGGQGDREAACWRIAALALLRSRGQDSGLSDYLDEVQQKLVPLLQRGAS